MEVWEEPDEIQDFSARKLGFLEGKKSKRRCEVSEVSLDVLHKIRCLEEIYPKFLEVRERRKVTQGVIVNSRLGTGVIKHADTESLDERKQTKFV